VFFKIFAFAAKLRRTGATLGLGFIVRNPIRDQWAAGINSKYGYVPFLDLIRGLYYITAGSRVGGRFSDNFQAAGGSTASMIGADIKQDELRVQDYGYSNAFRALRRAWREDKLTAPLLPLQKLSTVLELATRVGAFAKAKRKGATDAEAAVEAREITLDFNRMGRTGQVINGLEAFFNPEIQDIDKLVRNFRDRPLPTLGKIFVYMVLPALANWAMNKDDEEYQNLHEWDKMMFMHIKMDDGGFFRIPRPIGIMNAFFGYGFQKSLEAFQGENPEATAELVDSLVEQTPLHYFAAKGTDGGLNVTDMLPTAMEPIAEIMGNYDTFRERPIIPRSEENIMPEFQGEGVLGPAEQALGEAFGTSPYVAQHAVRGYGATVGNQALELANMAMGHEKPMPETGGQAAMRLLGLKSQRPIGFGSRPVADFYELADKALKADRTITELLERGNVDAALRVQSENPEWVLSDLFESTKRDLSEIRAHRKAIIAAGLPPQERAQLLLEMDMYVSQVAGMMVLNHRDLRQGK
jgi:hypothetical protein